jgi:hypothetical protein
VCPIGVKKRLKLQEGLYKVLIHMFKIPNESFEEHKTIYCCSRCLITSAFEKHGLLWTKIAKPPLSQLSALIGS